MYVYKKNSISVNLFPRYRGYLTVVSEEGSEKATVTVFDVQNKFIAFSAPIKPVMGVVAEWGTILMITQVNCHFSIYLYFSILGRPHPSTAGERHPSETEHAFQEKFL